MSAFYRPDLLIIIIARDSWDDNPVPGRGCLIWFVLDLLALLALAVLTSMPS